MDLDLIRRLSIPADTKVVLCVLDGLGGLAGSRGRTELESANIRPLDRLARHGATGLTIPVAPGVTPGSGPGHMALFGLDPLVYDVGRGVLEATGIDFPLGPNDLAARANFCTVGPDGLITDRRAGPLATQINAEICAQLREIKLPGVEVFVEPVREHRFVLVLRGEGLAEDLSETDPQREGVAVPAVHALTPAAQRTPHLANAFVTAARERIAGRGQANHLTLRG